MDTEQVSSKYHFIIIFVAIILFKSFIPAFFLIFTPQIF